LKGTVEERLNILFELYDMDEDGFVELNDVLAITKSAMVSSVYLAEMGRDDNTKDDHYTINTKQFEMSIQSDLIAKLPPIRIDVGSVYEMIRKVIDVQWNIVKEATTKQFKEINSKSKVDVKEFSRYYFQKFGDVIEFMEFYANIVRYGYQYAKS